MLHFDELGGTTMFHTYVLASSGNRVDIDRASFLMNHDLYQEAISAIHREWQLAPQWNAADGAQWVWDYYCRAHYDHYGRYFEPDVDPSWDRIVPKAESPAGTPIRAAVMSGK